MTLEQIEAQGEEAGYNKLRPVNPYAAGTEEAVVWDRGRLKGAEESKADYPIDYRQIGESYCARGMQHANCDLS